MLMIVGTGSESPQKNPTKSTHVTLFRHGTVFAFNAVLIAKHNNKWTKHNNWAMYGNVYKKQLKSN